MVKRISNLLLNRIQSVEDGRSLIVNKPYALVPEMIPIDEWEKLASASQAILKANVKSDDAPDYGNIPEVKLIPLY